MTLEELQLYTGAPPSDVDGELLLDHRDGMDITSWRAREGGQDGWWWAIHRETNGRNIVLAIVFRAGVRRDRDRAIEIGLALASRQPVAGELSS